MELLLGKKEVKKKQKVRDEFRERMGDNPGTGLRLNGKLLEPTLLEVTQGKNTQLYAVIGSTSVTKDGHIAVSVPGVGTRYLNINLNHTVERIKVPKKKKKKEKKNG